jgi:hypothetical protein
MFHSPSAYPEYTIGINQVPAASPEYPRSQYGRTVARIHGQLSCCAVGIIPQVPHFAQEDDEWLGS